MRNDLITIITEYPNGTEIVKSEKTVFAEKKSVTRTEFYTASQSGISVRYIYSVNTDDYNSCVVVANGKEYKPSLIKVGEVKYNIVRDYNKGSEETELTVR